jgi:hypothetical protein
VAIGHPRGLRFSASAGIVSAVRESSDLSERKVATEDERRWIQTTAMVAGGSSGGPLLSEAGQVLGVIAFNLPDQGISFAAHVGHLIELMDSGRGRPTRGLPGEPLADDIENPLEELLPRVASMYAEYRNAIEEFGRQLEEASNPLVYRLIAVRDNPGPRHAERFLKIADQERRTAAGFQALYLATQIDEPMGQAPSLRRALDRLAEDHLRAKGLHHALPGIGQVDHEATRTYLRKVLQGSPHRQVRGPHASSWPLPCRPGPGPTRRRSPACSSGARASSRTCGSRTSPCPTWWRPCSSGSAT